MVFFSALHNKCFSLNIAFNFIYQQQKHVFHKKNQIDIRLKKNTSYVMYKCIKELNIISFFYLHLFAVLNIFPLRIFYIDLCIISTGYFFSIYEVFEGNVSTAHSFKVHQTLNLYFL